MLYLMQVLVYMLAMLLVYFLFLRNRPYYAVSRWYLMGMALIPLALPLVPLPARYAAQLLQAGMPDITLPEVMIYKAPAAGVQWLWVVYGAGALLCLLWQVWNGYRLWLLIANSKQENQGGYSLVITPGYGPGSFGKYIFCPEAKINDTILAHEAAHIRLHHSRDLLALNALQALTWPNLLLVWIKKELKEVHEFQADEAVNPDKAAYTKLLLCAAFHTRSLPLMHSFIIHPIKRRIMMLNNNGKASPLKATMQVIASATIIFATVLFAQSCGKNTSTRTINAMTTAEKMPEAPYNYQQFLAENIVYPPYARKNNIEGRVIVKFIVDADGSVTNPTILRSPDQSLSDETIRVMNKMPKWTPGENKGIKVPVYFMLPVSFKLQ